MWLAVFTTSVAAGSFLFHSVAARGGTGFTGAVSGAMAVGLASGMGANTGCAAKDSAWGMGLGPGAAKGYNVSCIGGRWL